MTPTTPQEVAMTKLLPCPFCGGEGDVFENPWSNGEWEAQCKLCTAGPAFKNSEAEAIAAWNTREGQTP